ncbi:MAG: acyltransferase [Thermoguttaceae bacterium]|nr:acyltransferase [Thermoguttaceae bacterium]MBR4104698.1 acyltransferase [Thermoguttaceae bacterium]
MLLVVFFHSSLFWSGRNWLGCIEPKHTSNVIPFLCFTLQSFHTRAFTLISGYLFYYLKFEKGKYNRFVPFVTNKASRLVAPLILVSLFWIIPLSLCVFPDFETRVIDKFLLLKSPSQLWFLMMLFNTFVFFHFFASFFAKHTYLGFAVLLAFHLCCPVIPSVFQLQSFANFAILFGIGFKLRQFKADFTDKRRLAVLAFGALCVLIVAYNLEQLENLNITQKCLRKGISLGNIILSPIAAFFLLQKLAARISWQNNPTFQTLARYSMAIYLLHQQIIYFTIIAFNGLLPIPLHVGINFVVSTTLSLLIALLLTRYKLGRVILGEGK